MNNKDKEYENSIERPLQEIIPLVFDKEMTPWELVERVYQMKRGSRIEVIFPPDHPARSSMVAIEYLGQVLGRREGVTVVCGDNEIRLQLKRAGVTVRSGEVLREHEDNANDQFKEWAKGEISMPQRKRYKFISKTYYISAGICAVVVLFLFSTVLPRAEVVVIAHTKEVAWKEQFVADTRWRTQEKDPYRLRARLIQQDAHISIRVPITELSESGSRAEGILSFENQTGNEVAIYPDTPLVSDDGIVYEVNAAITIPPATIAEDNSVVFGTMTAHARAKDPGEAGNRASGRIAIPSLPPSKQARVYALITVSFTGGMSRLGKVVNEAHISEVMPQARQELQERLDDELRAKREEEWWFVPKLSHATTTHMETAPIVGTEADEMTVTLDGTLSALLLMNEDLYRLFGIYERDCTDDHCQISVSAIKKQDYQNGIAEGELTLVRRIAPGLRIEDLKQEIIGKSVQEARHLLLSKPGIQDVRISLRMSIRRYLPRGVEKISMRVE